LILHEQTLFYILEHCHQPFYMFLAVSYGIVVFINPRPL